ncbi:signal recognition particle-docking protein FtsY [Candidatus Woesearchaeota archaeon]|nr:signal recognition particle-docking protein FtsY [Candidatus Woesearchaeota archaeon]
MEEIRKELKQKETELQKSEKDKRKGGIISRVTTAFKTEEGVIGKLRGIVTTTTISEKRFDELFEEMEIVLLENNVALEVIDKIKDDLKNAIVNTPVPRGKVQKAVTNSLRESIEGLFQVAGIDLVASARGKKPYVILFAGINGSGKTTTIAKLAKLYKDNGMECVIAAADTFRAAAIQQIQLHAKKIGVPVIKHDYGADPAAVAYDAVSYAKAKNIDVVLIDTAGRQHSNKNLIAELAKIARVTNPDLKIFVGESITGNDCTNQAAEFNNAIGVDGIILAKADVDEKGGAAISVSYVTKKPIIYLGTGQDYADLTPFNPELVVKSLGLAA